MSILFTAAMIAGGAELAGGAIFFVVFAAVAFIAFKLLRRTVKMAFRIIVVVVILAIAIAGGVAFWALGSGSRTTKPTPASHSR